MTLKRYKTLIILIIITRILDGFTTYLASPDLEYEMNVIIKYFNLSWFYVLILGLFFIIFTIILLNYAYKNQDCFQIKASSLKKYILTFFYGEIITFKKLLYKLPLIKQTMVFLGLVFPVSLVYYSFFLILNNTFMYLIDKHEFIYSIYEIIYNYVPSAHLIVLLSIIILTIYYTFKMQFENSQTKYMNFN